MIEILQHSINIWLLSHTPLPCKDLLTSIYIWLNVERQQTCKKYSKIQWTNMNNILVPTRKIICVWPQKVVLVCFDVCMCQHWVQELGIMATFEKSNDFRSHRGTFLSPILIILKLAPFSIRCMRCVCYVGFWYHQNDDVTIIADLMDGYLYILSKLIWCEPLGVRSKMAPVWHIKCTCLINYI